MEGKKEEELRDQLIMTQHRLIKTHKELRFFEMGKSEIIMLDVILKKEQIEKNMRGVYVSEIARGLNVSVPAVSKMLRSLEEKEYIERKVNPKDRRSTIVSVTLKGKEAHKRVFREMDIFLERVIERFGEANVKELVHLLKRYTEIIGEESKRMKDRIKEGFHETDI